jgi:predicted O-linked N-acetylglucosamine transferase (SPINDLY family)
MKLAQNLDGLEMLRAGMRARMKTSALCDAKSFARVMESNFKDIIKNFTLNL